MMKNKSDWKNWLFPGFFIFFSVFFEFLSIFFGYKRYVFSFELYISFFFFLIGSKRISVLLFLLAIAIEIALGMASILYLFEFSQIKTIFGFFFEAKVSYIFGFILSFALLFTLFTSLNKFSEFADWKRFSVLGAILLIAQFTFSLRDGNFSQPTLTSRWNLIFGSSFYLNNDVMILNRKVYALTSDETGEFLQIKKPSAVQLNWESINELPNKIMLIVAESWGKPKDDKIVMNEIAYLYQSKNIKDIKLSYVSSGGATIYGEFRELCGLIPTKLKFRKIDKENLISCLPHILAKHGFKTASLHGAHGTMYDRITWYPLTGIEKMLFKENLPFDKSKECYSFPGYCDRYLFKHALSELNSSQKVFLYWMSLNSHTPYDKRDVSYYDESICRNGLGEGYSEQLCTYHQLHSQFFKKLEEMTHDPSLKGMKVIVVGDHAPIFNDEESRDKFEKNQVSSVSFSVR